MTESMIVEAVRAARPVSAADPLVAGATNGVSGTADPDAVARFQAAMGVQDVKGPDPIPFASEATAAWRSAQVNNQGILHRIRALSQLGRMHGPSAGDMVELQYEVMNLSFQQEVVTKVADKSSNAIQTLIKNQ
jgi:type III secretion system YscI/HrpB-like protein